MINLGCWSKLRNYTFVLLSECYSVTAPDAVFLIKRWSVVVCVWTLLGFCSYNQSPMGGSESYFWCSSSLVVIAPEPKGFILIKANLNIYCMKIDFERSNMFQYYHINIFFFSPIFLECNCLPQMAAAERV